MLIVDTEIRDLALTKGLLSPFVEGCQDGVVSYGLTSAGYDLRLGGRIWVFKGSFGLVIDPKQMKNDKEYEDKLFDKWEYKEGESVLVPAHSYILAHSLEYIRMPDDLKGRCCGKSTYARCGLIVNTTPLEPAWHGHLTIEVANASPCSVRIVVGEGIAQLEFEYLTHPPEKNYEMKKGKYQGQGAEPVPGIVR